MYSMHFICILYATMSVTHSRTHVYHISYTHAPYKQGMLKPDGHTVSVSDLFFIAHSLGMMARRPHAPHA